MKYKALVMAALLCMAAAAKTHAFGIGAQFNFCAGGIFAPGASLLISPGDRFHMAFNWYLDFDDENIIGITLDGIPLQLPLSSFRAGSLNFTLGIGAYINVVIKEENDYSGGLRIPVGFNLLLGQKNAFEIFTHVAPSFGVTMLPKMGLSTPFFPIALGARLWFR